MKIYTKTGDAGQTGLFSGTRIAKYDLRLHAYGTLDELKSAWARRTNGQCVFISALHKDQFDALREMIYRNASTIHAVRFPFDTFLY